MTAFDYLSVLLSIVLGLAITQLLSGFAGLVRARDRMVMYWPLPVQMTFVFLSACRCGGRCSGCTMRGTGRSVCS